MMLQVGAGGGDAALRLKRTSFALVMRLKQMTPGPLKQIDLLKVKEKRCMFFYRPIPNHCYIVFTSIPWHTTAPTGSMKDVAEALDVADSDQILDSFNLIMLSVYHHYSTWYVYDISSRRESTVSLETNIDPRSLFPSTESSSKGNSTRSTSEVDTLALAHRVSRWGNTSKEQRYILY